MFCQIYTSCFAFLLSCNKKYFLVSICLLPVYNSMTDIRVLTLYCSNLPNSFIVQWEVSGDSLVFSVHIILHLLIGTFFLIVISMNFLIFHLVALTKYFQFPGGIYFLSTGQKAGLFLYFGEDILHYNFVLSQAQGGHTERKQHWGLALPFWNHSSTECIKNFSLLEFELW